MQSDPQKSAGIQCGAQSLAHAKLLPSPYVPNARIGSPFQDITTSASALAASLLYPKSGGHFSGRLTAPLVFAGGIAKQLLAREGVYVGAHIARCAGVADAAFDPVRLDRETLLRPGASAFPTLDAAAGERMREEIEAARMSTDSVGGVVECGVVGFPAGVGSPMFDGLENRIASIVFGIPAVKGLEFGDGFAAAELRGSEHNDPFRLADGRVVTETNHAGGILGGISSGMPILLRAAFKPTASIAPTDGRFPRKRRAGAGRQGPARPLRRGARGAGRRGGRVARAGRRAARSQGLRGPPEPEMTPFPPPTHRIC